MENTNTRSEKLFIGFGILTVVSGILLVLENNYLIGISGSIVGAGLIFLNMKKLKEKNSA